MAVDWVLPAYLLFIAVPGLFGPRDSAVDAAVQRKNLVIQLLVVGLVAATFFMDRLPYLFSSMRQYGVPFRDVAEFPRLALGHLRYLFPTTAWAAFALLGCLGIAEAWRGTDLGFGSAFNRRNGSAPDPCSQRGDQIVWLFVLFS